MNTYQNMMVGQHHRNGHLIELFECEWLCLLCGSAFDAATDADHVPCDNVVVSIVEEANK